MGTNERAKLAYDFLHRYATTGASFSVQELLDQCGWKKATFDAYKSKKWREYLIAEDSGKFRVKAKFRRITEDQYFEEFTQNETIETEYTRWKHPRFIQFEFLLPLTREDKLTRALDDLFFKDTIKMRLEDIGPDVFSTVVKRPPSISDDTYFDLICKEVNQRFAGYSVSHVRGRYRASDLLTQPEAAELVYKKNKAYLIDETTASVRFIVPCLTGGSSFEEDAASLIDDLTQTAKLSESDLQREIALIRVLFFQIFVEAVVASVQGEEEIWLVETGESRTIYKWCRDKRKPQRKQSRAKQ